MTRNHFRSFIVQRCAEQRRATSAFRKSVRSLPISNHFITCILCFKLSATMSFAELLSLALAIGNSYSASHAQFAGDGTEWNVLSLIRKYLICMNWVPSNTQSHISVVIARFMRLNWHGNIVFLMHLTC